MNQLLRRIFSGFIRIAIVYIPIKITWIIISYFDDIWNNALWRKILDQELHLVGFILSLICFYAIGSLTETRLGRWIDRRILNRIPMIGYLLMPFNPQTSEILQKSKGAFIANFQSGWQYAFLTAVHKTKRGYLGSVLYGTLPPTRQMINERSRVYAIETRENGHVVYKMIPTKIALQHELSSGMTVPQEAYKDAVEISFLEFIKSCKLLGGYLVQDPTP